jgi:glycine/D-amino acid oxidase-like deaminating enzyme/nitrite reductase/ring-hydroxylating ferredoxin subunit
MLEPLWIATTSSPARPPLTGELRVDVAIIGAGITGLTAAVLLKERGLTVAVLEKSRVAYGESGHTTAHITEAVDSRYHSIAKDHGKDAAKLVAQASRASIEKIAELIERSAIDCRFRRLPGYLYTENRNRVGDLKKEAIAAREAGLDASWTESIPLPFPTRGGVRFENQAQFHPREYVLALAAQVDVYEHTHVTKIDNGVVETEHGRVVATHVFEATNVPIQSFQTLHTKAASYRSYAIALESDDPREGLFWDTADPYHYTRWQDDVMIVGGEDHRVGQNEDTDACFAKLMDYIKERFGERKVLHRWSGQIIEPHDGLPLIGGSGNLYVSTGYAGQGMTFGTIGGMLVADLITGVENPWAKLFDPGRLHLRGAVTSYVTENADFPKHLVTDRVLSRDVEPFDIANGEGKIVAVGGKKIAAYRDDAGSLHCLSPVCTHMKCDVAWNQAERTWDCPCHGSRFAPDGNVLNGPARERLEKLELGEKADQ